jgi:Uma2 family endonuclease
MTVTPYTWTIDRYHQAVQAGVFDDQPVELLNGEIVIMSPEGIPHAGYSSSAANYLRKQLGDRVLIREGHPITLSNRSEPEPDLAIVAPLEQLYKTEHHPYPENIFWLIEYADASLIKDTEIKRKTYASTAIQEYWVVNLKVMELVVYREPIDGDYQSEQIFTQGTIVPLAFPEVTIAIQRLLT